MKFEIALICLLLLSGAVLPFISQVEFASASPSDNWSMFHNDLSHSGYSTSSNSPVSPSLLWNFTTNNAVSASSTIVDDHIYVGSLGGIAYCLNAKDGAIIWNYTVHARTQGLYGAGNTAISSSMAVVDGHVYFGCYDRNVYCLDASTGNKEWNYTTGNSVESSPSIYNGHVYVGSWDGNIYCLDALTGTKIWNYTTGSLVESSPAVVDDKVYAGSVDGNVYCLNATTGDKIWSYTTGNLVQSSPAVANGRVYIGQKTVTSIASMLQLAQKFGVIQPKASLTCSPAVANGYVYVGCTRTDAAQDDFPSNVYCLDASTGDKVWNFTMAGGGASHLLQLRETFYT